VPLFSFFCFVIVHHQFAIISISIITITIAITIIIH